MKKAIETREDIELLVDQFYSRILKDAMLRPIFIDIAGIQLEEHLPILYDFWEGLLLQTNNYRRNTMAKHLELNRKFPLTKTHFDRWLALLNETIDEFFEGSKADLAKVRALSIATMMQIKMTEEKGEK